MIASAPRMHGVLLALTVVSSMCRAATPDPLVEGFAHPPAEARPRVWWHWMNGNITPEGIRLDLEWMHRVGLGGLQNFDAAFDTPTRVEPRVTYMTTPWQQAFRGAAQTAQDLSLELSIAGSPGWSESGGPWVKPEAAMKKIVWSSTTIEGGRSFSGTLPHPPTIIGPLQDVAIDRTGITAGAAPAQPVPEFYRDVAVVAYRLPVTEKSMTQMDAIVTTSGPAVDSRLLWDGELAKTVSIPFGTPEQPSWIQVAFPRPQTIRAMTLSLPSALANPFFADPHPVAQLQSSLDGQHFADVVSVRSLIDSQQTLSFAPVTARYFRLLLPKPVQPDFLAMGLPPMALPKEHHVAELVLHGSAQVNHFEQKAAFFVGSDLTPEPSHDAPPEAVVAQQQVIDLTGRMASDGSLRWSAPPGRWAILRVGCSLLGITNHPSSPEGTGLEVDKLNAADVRDNYTQYLGRFESFLGPGLMGTQGLRGMVNDSWEAGAQNWTDDLFAEFKRRRGYDLHQWLPALTGVVIGSPQTTDAFLWDFRQTLGELLAENHYQVIADELHKRQLIHYSESHESGRAFIGDGMAVKRFADVPMSAMWAGGIGPQDRYDADIRESASVAHLYGRPYVAAESFTAAGNTFGYTPESLKPTADRELANGLNRFVIHTSVHQPLNDPGPGFTLGPFGQWFTRHETWAEQATVWVSYLARSAFLLQQGRFAADVLYYYGEDSNLTLLYADALPPIPEGYAFDFANPEALQLLSVEHGALVTASGMRYRVLVLDPRTRIMSLPVLRRLHALVSSGATLIGAKPTGSPSLADDTGDYRRLADELWGSGGEQSHTVGRGRVIQQPMSEAFASVGMQPDFSYAKPEADSKVWFVHRTLPDGEIYFVNNRQQRTEHIDVSFRTAGRVPEVWHADSGRIERASFRVEAGRTIVPLSLDPADAVFVVFRQSTSQLSVSVPQPTSHALLTLDGSWQVHFGQGQAAPAETRFDTLQSWTRHSDPGIRYFSGTAGYQSSFNVDKAWLAKGAHLELDLGSVKNIAEVSVNGRQLGIAWKAPFVVDLADAVRPGVNQLEIRVTNTWVNRLIGDQQPGARPYAWTSFDPYKADSALLESGLMGPVRLLQVGADP